MSNNKNKYHRRSIRLKEYDYTSPGWYYVTICTHQQAVLFGDINNGRIVLSSIGKMAREYWLQIPNHFKFVELDEFVIMPNHIHGIIIINDRPGNGDDNNGNGRGVRSNAPANANVNPQNYFSQISAPSGTLGVIVRSYKSSVTRWCRKNKFEYFQWQRNYYEHIIRNEQELYQIRKYIRNNPAKWELDNEHPDNK
jgi:REP element-mobilizing transposase RayT